MAPIRMQGMASFGDTNCFVHPCINSLMLAQSAECGIACTSCTHTCTTFSYLHFCEKIEFSLDQVFLIVLSDGPGKHVDFLKGP